MACGNILSLLIGPSGAHTGHETSHPRCTGFLKDSTSPWGFGKTHPILCCSLLFLKLPGVKLEACLCLSVCVAFHCQELLNRKLSGIPSPEEATMVTWEELEQAITDGWKGSQVVNRVGGPGGGQWSWKGPLNPTVFCYMGVYNFIHEFSINITDSFNVFPQAYKEPCSNVTFTQVKVFIG